ncbi:hypothetical protein SELMODRAFT_405851 [Selaginella moellendorffii]|uniref:Uncharacterized protein n=1 Tax=Selaginella moellendorffii TaxID=88036 RepID=D8QZW4_SELML|nr:hypothetical protein SELMODRAFT_405851 [Selaginella moellendorffii]
MVVRVESVSTIVPAVLAENYLKQVYYYPAALDHISSFDSLVASLKDSLSRILVPYYPLAGRPRITGLDRPILDCNDRGIEFVVAFTDASFGDWGNSMKQCSIGQELNPAQTAITDPENFPQLKVQVTKFRCGGIALGLVTSHTLLDGSSVFPFLKAWSELHRGFPPPNPPPSFDSSLLKAWDPPSVTVPVRDFVAVTPAIAEEMDKAAQDFKPSYHVRAFHMNEQQLAELKHEIASGPFAYGSSLRPPSRPSRLSSGSASPMPSEYCGTSSFTLCLPCAVGDLKNKHISHTARLFHEDVRNVGQERIQSTIDWMEETLRKGHEEEMHNTAPLTLTCTGMGIFSVSLHSFPVYEFEFGGRPAHFSMVLEPWYGNGVVVLLPMPQGGMRERRIVVMLLVEQMKRLLQSELFARFALSFRLQRKKEPVTLQNNGPTLNANSLMWTNMNNQQYLGLRCQFSKYARGVEGRVNQFMSYKTIEYKSLLAPLEVYLSYEEPEASHVAPSERSWQTGVGDEVGDYKKSLTFASRLQGGHIPELIQEKVVSFVETYNQQYTKETETARDTATSKPKDAMVRHELEYLRSGNELELLSLLPNARDEEEPSDRARGTTGRASGKAG